MTKSLNLIAALAAFFANAGTAVADGDYYAGASRGANHHFDLMQTKSVRDPGYVVRQDMQPKADGGDYYEGVERPQ